MKVSDEIKKEISTLKNQIEDLQKEEKYKDALKLAEEMDKKLDQLKIELAKEKATFENFLKGPKMQVGGTPTDTKNYGVEGEEYKQQFLNSFRRKFQNDTSYLRESSNPHGGYLLPTEFGAEIVSKLANENVMRQICNVFTTSNNHQVAVVSSPPSASWVSEGQMIDLTIEEFSQITLGAHKLAAAISVSNEMLADSFYNLEEHITTEFAKALGAEEEKAFIVGDGNGQPLGVLTSVAADSDCYLTTPETYLDARYLINLQYSLERQYRRNACWLTNDTEMAQIRQLKDEYGHFLWQPALTEGEPARLLGSPIYSSPYVPSDGNKPLILYGDFSRYYIAERGQRAIKALREIHALQDLTTFLMIERVDGKLIDKNAIKGLKITTT